jgi:hypothetical protein
MPLRRLAVPALLTLVLATGCSGSPPAQDLPDPLPDGRPTSLACGETVTAFYDDAPDAGGSTLGRALDQYLGDDADVEVVGHTASGATAVVSRDGQAVAVLRASRAGGGWFVNEVERCVDP